MFHTDETQTKSFPKKQTSALHSKIINAGKMWVIITLAIEKGLGSIQDRSAVAAWKKHCFLKRKKYKEAGMRHEENEKITGQN